MSIELQDVTVTFRDPLGASVPVLDVPSLSIEDGRQVCLSGGSGSGKTTLLNVIAGITRPNHGKVVHDGTDLSHLSEPARDRFRAQHVGYVFQTFNLLQGLSAKENVLMPAWFGGKTGSASRTRAAELLERMGLRHRMESRPGTLSVGEQQRVAIARAVMNEPKVVLADEPTANLDEKNGDEVLELLREVTSESGSILVLVTHEERVRSRFDDVIALSEVNR